MKHLFILLLLISTCHIFAQDHENSIMEFQLELNKDFKDSSKSPLPKEEIESFEGLDFYPIDEKYCVKATFIRTENAVPFKMKTTTDRLPTYEVYGVATFQIDNQEFKLNIYQSHSLRETEAYKSYLFLPFTDATNGEETYGGGRFIDLEIPEDGFITIDFNKAYNPYCSYNHTYSCPIPPKENDLNIPIEAGVKL